MSRTHSVNRGYEIGEQQREQKRPHATTQRHRVEFLQLVGLCWQV
jgi:hypothetical protein